MSRQELVFTVHRQCTAFMDVIRSGRRFLPKVGRSQRSAADTWCTTTAMRPNCLFLVNEGVVRTSVLSSSGKELVTGVWGPGEVFGEFCLCQQQRERNERAVVVQDVELVRLGVEELIELVSVREGRAGHAAAVLPPHQRVEEKVAELAFANVRTRLGLLLLRLAQVRDAAARRQRLVPGVSDPRRDGPPHRHHPGAGQRHFGPASSEGAVAYPRTRPMRIFPDRLENRIEAP